MQIEILGSGKEVGKSAILVNEKTLLDYGVKIQPEPPSYPPQVNPDAVLLSHCHLDHSGAIPALYKKKQPPLFTNEVTMELTNLLLKDSLKIARLEGFKIPFTDQNRKKMIKNTVYVNYNQKFKIPNFEAQYFDAGHIPGSCSVHLKEKGTGKRLYYTGDIKYNKTHLLNGCALPHKTDILVTESTYGVTEHENRKSEEKRFLETIEGILANEQRALIPVFAVGRAQEVLLLLEKYADKIALDGMTRNASEIMEFYKKNIRDPKKLKRILKRIFWIKNKKDREKALKQFPLILSSAGMMAGGPIVGYLKALSNDPNTNLLFTGYLVEDTPGYNLLMGKDFKSKTEAFEVNCKIDKFDFSAHAGKSELMKIIQKTNPEQVICVHGEHTKKFARDIENEFNIKAYAPKNQQTINI